MPQYPNLRVLASEERLHYARHKMVPCGFTRVGIAHGEVDVERCKTSQPSTSIWCLSCQGSEGGALSRSSELGFFVGSAVVTIVSLILIRWILPNYKSGTLSEMRPLLVPVGWGVLIALALMLAGLLAEVWKPFEYIVAPIPAIPAIALFVVLMRRRAKRNRVN